MTATTTRKAAADPWGDAAPTTPTRAAASDRRPAPRPQPQPAGPPAYKLSTRKPTGACAYPLILVDGGEYAGKSTTAVELANDPRIGQTWMLSVGEEIDWLGAIADFEIVNHNGQWWQIIAAVEQIHAETTRIKAAAKPGDPVPLVILDSGTKVHELLSNWAEFRARSNGDNVRKLMVDPNAEINVGHAFWNPANRRHRRLVALLRSMPAIVVITARGKMVSAFAANGQPIPNTKVYSVQANQELGFATTAWVRLAQGEYPQIVGARMAKGGIRPGFDEPLRIDPTLDSRFEGVAFSLAWLIFDVLKFDADAGKPSQAIEPVADAVPDVDPAAPGPVIPADADEAPGMEPADIIHPAGG